MTSPATPPGTPPGRAAPVDGLAPSSALSGSALAAATRRRLGDVLVDSGLLTHEQLATALEHQRNTPGVRRRLGQVVADMGLASERDVAECLANLLGLQMVDLSKTVPAPDVVRMLPRQIAERTRVLVLDRNASGLVVATADPTNVLALDDVRLHTRSAELTVMVATDSQIRDQINRAWALGQDNVDVSSLTDDEDEDSEGPSGSIDDDAPIVKLVNQVLADAVRMRASDIHIEVQRDSLRVRYRVDGLLRDVMNAPKRIATSVISRIKIISGLDIAERRVPQDGRTRFAVEGLAVDARISTLPSLHGEKVVIRLLSRGDGDPQAGRARLHRQAAAAVPGLAVGAAGAGADHRTDRVGQDEHPVLGDRGDPLAGEEHRHPGGPDRGPASGDHPGRESTSRPA